MPSITGHHAVRGPRRARPVPAPRSVSLRRRLVVRAGALLVGGVVASGAVLGSAAGAAYAGNPVTPGDFTGYGFDQCTAPTQAAMDTWMQSSPFLGAGIYISGDSRGCRSQPNLTPDWVARQLASGWRLLPITLGPQASCTTRARYLKQVRINPSSRGDYGRARAQGRQEAEKTVRVAQGLGLVAGSVMYYDLEGFSTRSTSCTRSALGFLSGWTNRLHAHGYLSGVYSSAASGMKVVDDARFKPSYKVLMPDQIWIADWNGVASTSSSYLRSDGWSAHQRVHQYRGGHTESWGRVAINIDSNWLDVGRGSVAPASPSHCGGVTVDLPSYPATGAGSGVTQVQALQCLLKEKALYAGPVDGAWSPATAAGVNALQSRVGHPVGAVMAVSDWMSLLSWGTAGGVVKYGSAGFDVRRAQRALDAAVGAGLPASGVADSATTSAVAAYQRRIGLPASGILDTPTWAALSSGRI